MEDFRQSLTSPSWWLGVVVVGFAINLISAYIKQPIDQAFSWLSTTWSERSQRAKERRAQDLELLVREPSFREIFWRSELRSRLSSLSFLLLATFLSVIVMAGTSYLQFRFPEPHSQMFQRGYYWWAIVGFAGAAFAFSFAYIELIQAGSKRTLLHQALMQSFADKHDDDEISSANDS